MEEATTGITLRAARINAGLEQKEVANLMSVSVATMSSWETGKTHPNILQARKLSQLYKIPIDRLIFLPVKSREN